jgi:teichuronic acid exporter
MPNINDNLRRSVSANVIGRYSNILIQLLVTGVLARTLDPRDFGLMAIVSVLAVFLSFLSEMGLGPAIIQFRDLTVAQLAGLFWITICVGVVAGCAFAVSGPWIAAAYRTPAYVRIAQGMGLNIALSCWAIVPLALMRRSQRFKAIAGIEVGSAVLSGACAVAAALHGWGVHALVLKSVSNALFFFVLCMCLGCPALSIRPTPKGMRHVLSYSTYQFLFNVLNYFTRNLDKLLIGRFLGAAPLGLYDMSYRLMLMPVTNLTHVITPALQPVYAAHGGELDTVFNAYQKLVRFLVIAGGLLGLLCLVCSNEIISIAYGDKWQGAAVIFSVLSLSIAVQVVLSSTGSVFQALGRTDLLFKTGLISTLTTVVAVIIGIWERDVVLLSWLLVGGFFINAVQGFHILSRQGFGRSAIDLFRPVMPMLVGIALLSCLGVMLRHVGANGQSMPLFRFVTKAVAVCICYGTLACVTGDAAFLRKVLTVRRRAAA